jgi:hypothetical protein
MKFNDLNEKVIIMKPVAQVPQIAQVAIPATYFTQNIKRQYSNCRQALFREFLQNSIDAGSTKIDFIVTDTAMSCNDNGCGMDTDLLVRAMLTLSGSVKTAGSTGGFGEAKNLLLFAHKEYTIHTRNNFVQGSCLSYNLDSDAEYKNGTSIEIEFHESFGFDKEAYIRTGIDFIKRCSVGNVVVSINGQQITNDEDLEFVFENDWCKIFTRSSFQTNYAAVRKNGIEMFEVYLNETSDKKFIIELTLNSIDCLSSNRDSMQYQYREELSKITNNIQMNQNMFGKLYNQTITYEGKNKFSIIQAIQKFIKQVKDELSVSTKQEIENYVVALQDTHDHVEMERVFEDLIQIEPYFAPEFIKMKSDIQLESNFIVDIQKKGIDKLPEKFDPQTMQKKYKTLALLWKASMIKVIETMGGNMAFNIGWVISDDALAQFKEIDGGYVFQVNPEYHWDLDKKKMIMSLLTAACHEYTHVTHSDHGESFTSENFKVVRDVFTNLSSWREILQISETISL